MFSMGKTLTPNFSIGCAPSAVKMEHNKAGGVDYLHKKISTPLALTVTEILTIKFEIFDTQFWGGACPSAPKLERYKVPVEDYLQ